MITYTYKVSMTPGGIPVRCKLGQYDDDWTIVFTLYSAYGTFSIESGTTAKIRGTKRDGLGYSANATINISAGTVTVAGDKQITAVAGDNLFELVLLKGTKELSTANIIFSVEPAAMDAGTLVSDSQVQEILDMSADVIAASANVSTLRGNFAPAYSSSSTYSVGDYAMYNNQLYRCTTAISTAEAWTAGHWTAVALGDDVSDLKSDLYEHNSIFSDEFGYLFPTWEHGNISSQGEASTNLVARTNYIPFVTGQKLKVVFPDYFNSVRVLLYKEPTYDNSSYITLVNLVSGQEYQFNNDGLQYIRFRAVANNEVVDLLRTFEIIPQILGLGINADIDGINTNIAGIHSEMDFLSNGSKKYSYTVSTDLVNGYVESTDGSFGSLSTYKRTGFVQIPNGANQILHTFPFSSSGTDGWAVYDENKTYITGGRTSQIEVKENYAFFAISCRLSAVVDDKVTLTFLDANLNNCDYNIVMHGDSINGNYDGDDSVPAFLNAYSKANCYNCAFGGSTMGADLDHPHQYIEAFNGFKIINAIVSNDYSEQLQAIADDPQYTELRANFAAHVATLQGIDWSTVDVVTLSFGTNDWGTRVILDDPTDDHSTDTFTGALRTAIETLLTAYPHIKVAVCAPIWRGIVTQSGVLDDDTDTSKATRQWYLNDYREKAKAISDEYHALYIDAYQGLNFNKFTWKNYFPLNDATHPNATGRQVIAKKYAYCLASI